jgi:hypothetical protein
VYSRNYENALYPSIFILLERILCVLMFSYSPVSSDLKFMFFHLDSPRFIPVQIVGTPVFVRCRIVRINLEVRSTCETEGDITKKQYNVWEMYIKAFS